MPSKAAGQEASQASATAEDRPMGYFPHTAKGDCSVCVFTCDPQLELRDLLAFLELS